MVRERFFAHVCPGGSTLDEPHPHGARVPQQGRPRLRARREPRLGLGLARDAAVDRPRLDALARATAATSSTAASATSASASRWARRRRVTPAARRRTRPTSATASRASGRRTGAGELVSSADGPRRAAPRTALRPRRRGSAAGPRRAAVRRHRPRAARRAAPRARRTTSSRSTCPRTPTAATATRTPPRCSSMARRGRGRRRTTSPRCGRSCRTTPGPTAAR